MTERRVGVLHRAVGSAEAVVQPAGATGLVALAALDPGLEGGEVTRAALRH